MNRLMCEDENRAKLNRERVARGETNRFYNEQAHAIAQWGWGEDKPESVVVGELPYVGVNQIRLDRG